MKLRVERLWKKPAYTVGRLFVDGKFFLQHTGRHRPRFEQ